MQRALDRRQRDVDYRGVEHGEELRTAQQQQDQQPAAGRQR
jgi:hypothetical protein